MTNMYSPLPKQAKKIYKYPYIKRSIEPKEILHTLTCPDISAAIATGSGGSAGGRSPPPGGERGHSHHCILAHGLRDVQRLWRRTRSRPTPLLRWSRRGPPFYHGGLAKVRGGA